MHTYVKKSFYQDVQAKTGFGVCFNVGIDLEFDKDILEYSLGEPVEMTVHLKNENGEPFSVKVESVLMLPDGSVTTDLRWNLAEKGVYTACYSPAEEGVYSISVEAAGDARCYLETDSGMFYVDCDEVQVELQTEKGFVNEPTEFTLFIFDENCNLLPGAKILSFLHLPNDSTVILSWTEQEDGTYTTEYTPSNVGDYSLHVEVLGAYESGCYRGSAERDFTIFEELPDLVVHDYDIQVEPTPLLLNTVTITVTVRNEGYASAEEFWVYVYINDEKKAVRFIDHLDPNESTTFAFQWKVIYSGEYTILAIADPWEEME